MRVTATLLAACLPLLACTVEPARQDECTLLEPQDQEPCIREVRDPKWESEHRRREQVQEAPSPEDEALLECQGLSEADAAHCLNERQGSATDP